MGITLKDMDKVEAWKGGAMLPIGSHNVRIDRAEEGKSSGGYDQVELEFESLAGLGNIRDWLVFSPAALGKARMLLEAVGIQAQGGDWDFPTSQLQGKTLNIQVIEEADSQGKTNDDGTPKMRRRVAAYNSATGSAADLPGNSGDPDKDLPF